MWWAVKNIVFDLGGVIMTLVMQDQAIERLEGLGAEDARQRLNVHTVSGIFGDWRVGSD